MVDEYLKSDISYGEIIDMKNFMEGMAGIFRQEFIRRMPGENAKKIRK
jgi:hypothetical protein